MASTFPPGATRRRLNLLLARPNASLPLATRIAVRERRILGVYGPELIDAVGTAPVGSHHAIFRSIAEMIARPRQPEAAMPDPTGIL